MCLSRAILLVTVALLAASSTAGARVPTELRAAMLARDTAFYAVDSAQWEKFTAPTFTTVQQDGSFLTRAERLVQSADPDAAALRRSFARTE